MKHLLFLSNAGKRFLCSKWSSKKEHHEEELVNETEASQLVLSDAEDQASRIVEQANNELEKNNG